MADAGEAMAEDGGVDAPARPWPDACAPLSDAAVDAAMPDADAGTIVTVDMCHPGSAVPSNFLGLSVEWTQFLSYLGDGSGNANPVAVQLLKNFEEHGHRVEVRIGGNTTDTTWWVSGPGTRGPRATFNVTPTFFQTIQALNAATGAHFILGLDFALGNPQNPAAFMQAAVAALPAGSIMAFEMGNEPNWYKNNMVRPAPYGFPQYEMDLDTYFAVLKPLAGSQIFCGPSFGELAWVPDVPMLFPKYAGDFGLLTLHRYPYSACSATPPTAASLLADTASAGIAQEYAGALSVASAQGIGLRLDEMGSITCGGLSNISQSYAATLWSIETLFELASAGVVGNNFHTPGGNAVFSFASTTDGGTPDGGMPSLSVHGEYYGMWFFAAGTAQGGLLMPVDVAPASSQSSVKAWATRGSDGLARVSLLNKDQTHAAHVTLQVPGSHGPATLARLEAPALDALAGIRFGGRTWDGSMTGAPMGSETVEMVQPQNGGYAFDMPALSGALVVAQP
jgi:hypothetical protein